MNMIHNIHCLEFMKKVPDGYFDLVLTDPPYGLGNRLVNGGNKKRNLAMRKLYKGKKWDVAPSTEVFNEIFRISKNQVIWGGNYFNLPPTRGFIVWDKNIGKPRSMSHVEMAWTSLDFPAHKFQKNTDRKRVHPTQKPTEVMEWAIEYVMLSQTVKTVLDPFMGSGSTAIACEVLGLEWCGCELESDYVDIANERLKAVQESLFKPATLRVTKSLI